MKKWWTRCLASGRWPRSAHWLGVCLALFGSVSFASNANAQKRQRTFERISHIPVFLNTSVDEEETVAEIITVTKDGKTLIYTDAGTGNIGYIDITNPSSPAPLGTTNVGGEPTSVATVNSKYAIVGVNTSPDFVNPSGHLAVIEIATQTVVESIDMGGQPDAVAVSKNGRYACVAIENERDEDLGDGEPPQAPPGFVQIVDIKGKPSKWKTRKVDLVGVPDLFPEDPEPEFVDINDRNVAVVTMQENNHIALIDLRKGKVIDDFSAGTVNLKNIDTVEDDIITLQSSLRRVPREPDGVTWTSNSTFATADEGDLFGGSRGFTLFDRRGKTQFKAGESVEYETVRLGHYPEGRSENKGNEPENVEYGKYGGQRYLFVGSERSSVVLVYRLVYRIQRRMGRHWPWWWWGSYRIVEKPIFMQTLPSGVGPEGLLAIPKRGLFVTASEEDARDDKIRSIVTIYKLNRNEPTYPTVVSADDEQGTPIPWAALSGLAADPSNADVAYTIHDSFYKKSRIYSIDLSQKPALIDGQTVIVDSTDVLRTALEDLKDSLPETATGDFDIEAIINDDGTINIDPEGISVSPTGGFWVASEGSGNLVAGVSDPSDRPFESPNMLLKINIVGEITDVVLPPEEITLNQFRFGFEGVSALSDGGDGEVLFVCHQRAWTGTGDASGVEARIGKYETSTGTWSYAYYPLDAPASDFGGWVGLSEITAIDGTSFAIVERDNQAGTDATNKFIYSISIEGVEFAEVGDAIPTLAKSLVRDLIPDLQATNGAVLEKIEGLSIQADGDVLIVNDNDGVDDSNGETQLINLGPLFD